MGAPDQKPTEQQKAKTRQAVTDRLRRFYGTLLSGLDADADEFFRRVMEQKKIRDHDHVGSRP